MDEKQLKGIVDGVVSAVEPVINEKIETIKTEVSELTKGFASKEDVVAAVGAKVSSNEDKEANAMKIMSVFAKELKKTKSAIEAAKALSDLTHTANETTDADGGFLVPVEFMKGVIDRLGNFGTVRQNATVIPMSRETYSMNSLAALPAVGYVDEGVEIPKQKLAFAKKDLTAKKVAALLPSTLELIEDSTPEYDVWNILMNAVVKALLKFEDTQGFSTILNSTATNIVSTSGANGNTLSYDNLVDMIFGLDDTNISSESELQWYGSRSALGQIKKLKDSNGQPILTKDGKDHIILGYKYNIVPVLPKMVNVTTAGTKFLVFGDLKALFLGDRKNVTLDIGEADGDFAAYKKTLRAVERIDLNLAYPEVLSVLKTAG